MFNFTDKLSPRVIGSAIKSRLSGQVPTRNGSPYNKVINRVTKTSKIAKDPRYKKQNNCRFSATAMLIVSQIGIRFLHQAVAQVSKPVIHRRVNTLPHESETAMVVDEVPAQPEERVVEMADQPEDHIVEMADWPEDRIYEMLEKPEDHIVEMADQPEEPIHEIPAQQEETPAQQEETPAQQEEIPIRQEKLSPQHKMAARQAMLNRPCMPALIVGGLRGKDIDQIDQIHPSRILTQNLFVWRQADKWEKGNLQRVCLSRTQIAAIERRKEREEDKEEERQRVMNRQPPKPPQPGDSIKLLYSDWKAKEWQQKRGVFEQGPCFWFGCLCDGIMNIGFLLSDEMHIGFLWRNGIMDIGILRRNEMDIGLLGILFVESGLELEWNGFVLHIAPQILWWRIYASNHPVIPWYQSRMSNKLHPKERKLDAR